MLSNSLGGCAAALVASGLALQYRPLMMRVMDLRVPPHIIPTAALAAFLVGGGAGRLPAPGGQGPAAACLH